MSDYKSKLQSEEMDFYCDALLALENREEVYKFLEDICTISEIKISARGFKLLEC